MLLTFYKNDSHALTFKIYNLDGTPINFLDETGNIIYFCIYDYLFNLLITKNSENESEIEFNSNFVEEGSTYVGEGINDCFLSGTYLGDEEISYTIKIDSIAPLSFCWSKDSGVTWEETNVLIESTNPIYLEKGISVKFLQANTGTHFINDTWVKNIKEIFDQISVNFTEIDFENIEPQYLKWSVILKNDDLIIRKVLQVDAFLLLPSLVTELPEEGEGEGE